MTRHSHLLHDTRLPLREGDVSTRLVLNELDLDLTALTARLVVVVIIVVGGIGGTLALDAARLVAVLELLLLVVAGGVLVDEFCRHG